MATLRKRISRLLRKDEDYSGKADPDLVAVASSPSRTLFTKGRENLLHRTEDTTASVFLAANNSSGRISELPDEVLRQIMILATEPYPDPYSGHCRAPIKSGGSTPFLLRYCIDPEMEIQLQKESQVTKIALSKVSKSWRNVSADVLFNTILLHSSRQIPLLSRALDGDKARRGEQEGPGSWAWLVRRLWVVGENKFQFWITLEDGLPSFGLLDLLQRCPNIITFRNFGHFTNHRNMSWDSFDERRQILDAIMRRTSENGVKPLDPQGPSHSEHPLDIDLDVSGIPADFIQPDSCFRFVQVLKLQCHDFYSVPSDNMCTGIDFPVLEYLHLSSSRWFSQATLFNMPALRRLSFDPRFVSPYLTILENESSKEKVVHFLECHGTKLEELSIIARMNWALDLDLLCPNLTSLNAVVIDYAGRTPKLFLHRIGHKKVVRVGFSGLGLDGYVQWEDSEAFFFELFSFFPNLRIAQDLSWNFRIIATVRRIPWSQPTILKPGKDVWIRTLELMQRRDVQLLDCSGAPFRLPDTLNEKEGARRFHHLTYKRV
jgi:hypothetical protein